MAPKIPAKNQVGMIRTVRMGVSKNNGTPKWMVKIMENPIKMDDLGGFTPIFGNTHIICSIPFSRSWLHHPFDNNIPWGLAVTPNPRGEV